ncbi:MAG: hypothetical protein R3343_03295 [Nitriliruptorales bacterium]|nr:hypothetical protein [Nitriliruptorales bacterium]
MAVEDVVALLGELRAAEGRLAKARVLGRGLVVLRDLSPRDRRGVALAIAEEAAPELAPRVRERTGLELDAATLTDILDLARDLDDESLESVISRLRDPDQRWDAVEELVEDALDPVGDPEPADTPATPTSADDVPEPPPGGAPMAPPAVADPHAVGAPPDPETVPAQEPPPPSPPAARPPQDTGDGAAPDGSAPARRGIPPPPKVEPAPPVPPRPPARPARDGDVPFPDVGARPSTANPDVLASVRAANTSLGKLRAVQAAGASIPDLGPEGRLELVRALPDGWVRRRAVHRMLELEVIAAGDCLPIIETFGRTTDRNWVAASMLDADLVTPDQLVGVLTDTARERLARRVSHR